VKFWNKITENPITYILFVGITVWGIATVVDVCRGNAHPDGCGIIHYDATVSVSASPKTSAP